MKRFFQKHASALKKADPIWISNPVLARGLTIAPIIVACTGWQRGAALSIAFTILTFFTVTATSFLPQKIPYTFRVILNALFSSLLFIPTALLIEKLFPGMVYQLGIYLPLLVINSIIIQEGERHFHRMAKGEMLLDLFFCCLGFSLLALFVGALRELLGKGSLFAGAVTLPASVSTALLPCGGFIIVAFLAAGAQKARLIRERRHETEKGDDTDA